MKKAFTLLEVVISISIFMVMILFMYKALDDTKISNNKFVEYINKDLNINDIYQIVSEDVMEKTSDIALLEDRDKNSLFFFETKNSYHDPFYTNVLYMNIEDKFIRIESLNQINPKEFSYEVLEDAYIDVLFEKVNSFKAIKDTTNKKINIFIELKNKEKIVFPIFEMEQ